MIGTPTLATARLRLEPLGPAHADEAYPAFADEGLYALMVGEAPPDVATLRARFERLAAGCPRPGERWLNWLARRVGDGALVGWHQATVVGAKADIAWVTFAGHRRVGYAREGAAAVLRWLGEEGVSEVVAQADVRNAGSNATAKALGFVPDADTLAETLHGVATVDRVWRRSLPTPRPDSDASA